MRCIIPVHYLFNMLINPANQSIETDQETDNGKKKNNSEDT